MSRPPEEEPVIDEKTGYETHPAFGLIGAERWSGGQFSLFDSEIPHDNTIHISIKAATRKRDLNHDWIHGNNQYIEVELSEAQWASFVSSLNVGDGVPCTITWTKEDGMIPGIVYSPRLALTMQETHDAAEEAYSGIQEAFKELEALDSKAGVKERRTVMDKLKYRIKNATSKVDFAGKQLIEQSENVVAKARADIEAIVVAQAQALGMGPEHIIGMQFPGLPAVGELEEAPDKFEDRTDSIEYDIDVPWGGIG